MSQTESQYGERWFEFDRAIGKQMELDNAKRQYQVLVDAGEDTYMLGDKEYPYADFQAWYDAGNYNRHDWGEENKID